MSWIVAIILAGWICAAVFIGLNGRPRVGALMALAWLVAVAILFIAALIFGFLDSLVDLSSS